MPDQQYYWRNAPVGIDVLTLSLGNPFHGLWGGALQHLYTRFGIDLIESGAWLGIAPLMLAACAVRRRPGDPVVRQWGMLGGIFFVWALGSHVHAAGQNTGLLMPEVLLRYVPIAANARMPGRAMVIVYLAIAVLAATSMAQIRWRRPAVALLGMMALVLADFLVAPFPIVSIECPKISAVRVLRGRRLTDDLMEGAHGLASGPRIPYVPARGRDRTSAVRRRAQVPLACSAPSPGMLPVGQQRRVRYDAS